jgi:hypothetical protein
MVLEVKTGYVSVFELFGELSHRPGFEHLHIDLVALDEQQTVLGWDMSARIEQRSIKTFQLWIIFAW